jgi:hypothetical protein
MNKYKTILEVLLFVGLALLVTLGPAMINSKVSETEMGQFHYDQTEELPLALGQFHYNPNEGLSLALGQFHYKLNGGFPLAMGQFHYNRNEDLPLELGQFHDDQETY